MTFRHRLTTKQRIDVRAKWMVIACTNCAATDLTALYDLELDCGVGWQCQRCGYQWRRPIDDLLNECGQCP